MKEQMDSVTFSDRGNVKATVNQLDRNPFRVFWTREATPEFHDGLQLVAPEQCGEPRLTPENSSHN